MRDLGAAGAFYVESTLRPDEVVGILAYGSAAGLVETLAPRPAAGPRVVQLSGGVGNPAAEEHQAQVARRLAARLGGEAVLLPAPAVAATPAARRALLADPFVQAAHALFDAVTLALLGIGTTHPPFLPPRGYMGSFTPQERALLEERGAVGFACHRFFDDAGRPVATPLDQRVIAATGAQLRRVPRRVGICGGPSRWVPLRAALLGR